MWLAGFAKPTAAEAEVIYPPVAVERFIAAASARRVLFCAVAVCTLQAGRSRLSEPLTSLGSAAGGGRETGRSSVKLLQGLPLSSNVQILSHQPADVPLVIDLMQRCKAFVFAAAEDFGISLVEAQAAGAPVIAYGKGGATEM